MWPMSHALYPGLSNSNARDRPTTADSHKTWYGNNRKSYASTSSLHSEQRSVHSLAPEAEKPGEDLGHLIHRTRRVLSVLSVDADKGDAGHREQDTEVQSSAGSGGNMSNTDREDGPAAVGEHERFRQGSGGSGSGHNTPSQSSPTSPSRPRPVSPATESTTSSSSIDSTVVSLASPDGEEDTAVAQSDQSLGAAEPTPEPGVRGVDVWNSEPPIRPAVHQEMGHCRLSASHLTNNKSSSPPTPTPQDDTTAAPSFTIAWEPSEKTSEFVNTKTLSADHGSSEGVPERLEQKEEQDDKQENTEEDPAVSHLSGLPLVSVTVALSAAVFLVAMDVNVIATAVPRITGEFRSLDDVGWYGSAFLMATSATQIPYGRVYSLFPAKWVFTSAILIFMLGSLIAGVSPNSPVLILGRAVQGVGTSGILSGGLIIMSQVVPLRIRPVLTSVIGAMEGVAMISAPIIGGVLTDHLHWRWCFYINLPIGGFVLLVVLFCMRTTKQTGRRRAGKTTLLGTLYELDVLGAATLLPPIVCTLLALHFAGKSETHWTWTTDIWTTRADICMAQGGRVTHGATTMSFCSWCLLLSYSAYSSVTDLVAAWSTEGVWLIVHRHIPSTSMQMLPCSRSESSSNVRFSPGFGSSCARVLRSSSLRTL